LSSANEMQVGGNHYSAEYQHWDWVVDVRLPYHPARATAYVARWRKKNGLQDLQKGLHFMVKTLEIGKAPSLNKLEIEGVRFFTSRFAEANGLDEQEAEFCLAVALGRYTKAKGIVASMVEEQTVGEAS